jgi:nitrogen fixation protein NifX
MKVAFATTDRKHVNQHFGSACSFVVYAIGPGQVVPLEVAQFETSSQDGHEDKLLAKLTFLEGCTAVYCQAVGGSAIRQLLSRGIQPVRVSEGTPIDRLLRELEKELRSGPSSWLAKAPKRQQMSEADHFDSMEVEGWTE